MIQDIAKIPDYAALKKLASALWQETNSYHGAAVMVGAGFSRCAASSVDSRKKLPLWGDFAQILAQELNSTTKDPLRLAEEYKAFFGLQALNDLIRKTINDKAWQPSDLHKSLLKLPWADILSTNWDTLLERTSEVIHEPVYSIVSKQDDLSCARAPRIVKLHGTIDVSQDFIFTQEDYRKYPQRHAAFVNFARQVFIENELCLLGFSGEDPNFLQWAGWVRDHLSNHARRIYLVGALNLSSAQRKYLESINVAPIDFYSLVAEHDDCDRRHFEATVIFLTELKKLQPKKAWEWEPTRLESRRSSESDFHRQHRDYHYAAKLLEEIIPALQKERQAYPGWLVCPPSIRSQLATQITAPWPNSNNLAAMDPEKKDLLLYEIAWRHQVSFDTIEPWLAKELLNVCKFAAPSPLTTLQQLDIALVVLKSTRWMDLHEAEFFANAAVEFLTKGIKFNPELESELAYHRAIVAKDQFDYKELEEQANKISEITPNWKIKKASLLAELGQFQQFDELLREAYKELLLQWRNERNSVYVISRLAWVHWLLQSTSIDRPVDQIPPIYRDAKCDPWLHVEQSQKTIDAELEKQLEKAIVKPNFQPGHYTDSSRTLHFSNEVLPLVVLDGIVNSVGIPLRWGYGTFFRQQVIKLNEFDFIPDLQRFSLTLRAASGERDDVLNKVFSRLEIARLSEESFELLLTSCHKAVDYFSKKLTMQSSLSFHFDCARLEVYCETLGRATVRSHPDKAIELFRLGISLGKQKNLQVLGLSRALKHLVEFSLTSIPKTRHSELLVDALSFPLPSEVANVPVTEWGNPIIKYPGLRSVNVTIDKRIAEIIDQIAPNSRKTSAAILRLAPLIESNFLTADEITAIRKKLWPRGVTIDCFPDIGLLQSGILQLPSPDFSAVQTIIRKYLFESSDTKLVNPFLLQDLVHAAQNDGFKELPSQSQAKVYFDYLVAWRIPQESQSKLIDAFNDVRSLTKLMGKVLCYSVTPSLAKAEHDENNFEKLKCFIRSVESWPALGALVYFAVSDSQFVMPTEQLIRECLHSRDAEAVAYASFAILIWREQLNNSSVDRLIPRLIHLIGVNQMACGLPALLWTVNQLYIKNFLTSEQVGQLMDIIPIVFDSCNYSTVAFSNREEVTVSLVRGACIGLAIDFARNESTSTADLTRILEEAKQDPLPEVRFAEGQLELVS